VRLDISGGSARVNSGSATATALTTTGRIGVNMATPGADLDVSGVARMAALSATSTALTTVGRIGVNTAAPTVDLDVSGVARMAALSATSTALTTVGRIGVNTAAPTVDLDVTGVSRLSASSATATALTTVGRIGVNMSAPTVDFEVNGLAKIGNVTIGANPLYAFTQHTFTNASATGRLGPTLANVRTAYSGVSWAQNNSYLSMTGDNGIQLWTVPVTGNYFIQARGAAGLDTRGGKGRDIQLTTTLVKGEVIRILVGQQGTGNAFGQSSGGGGTFVVRGTQTPIIVAGGGGGKGYAGAQSHTQASLTTSGNNSPGYGAGGTDGQGGVSSSDGGGGGMFGNGSGNGSEKGLSFINGGLGGIGSNDGTAVNGGFGGGGGGNGAEGGGGGGGYSGGGGGGGGGDSVGGGGGGSFGITTLTDYGAIITGHGSVTITLNSPSSDFDVAGVSRLSASSATATALTTTGRIGVNTAAPAVDLDVNGEGNILNGLTIGSSTNSSVVAGTSSKLAIYHANSASIFLRADPPSNSNGLSIVNNSSNSYIYHHGNTEFGLYCQQNVPMRFYTSNLHRMTITGAGRVGIGTNSPEASLHVGTSVSISFNGSTGYGYFRNDAVSGSWFINEARNISFIAENEILIKGNHILVSSDKRIKKNIRDIQGATALSQIRRIQPKVYNKIDDIYHQGDIYGFIAQDVEVVINNTSRINTSIIPNFYCKGDIVTIDQANHIYEISTENEFKFEKVLDASGNEISNYKIRIYDDKNKDYICTVIHRIDAKTIRVKCDKEYVYSTIDEYKNTVFIYGQEIHDFYNLDKNSIFTVATAALQEVDRQQQADKARIAELEATVASQQSLINDILERLKTNGM
jgi:hypothetical protein